MLFYVLLFVGSVVFVEGATELICKSLIFSGFRDKVSSWHPFLADLLKCGYCTSVWVAVLPSLFFAYNLAGALWGVPLLGVFFTVLIHRLANYLHNLNDKHLDKFYDQRLKR